MGLIDLNTTEDDETPYSAISSSSSSSHSGISTSASAAMVVPPPLPPQGSVCLELWHACAGPLISLPKKGSIVVYVPQGHFEQAHDFPVSACNIPPHVFCRVLDVKLHAEEGSDEVYCQVLLVPENQQLEQNVREGVIDADAEEEDTEAIVKSTTPHMFCKTLTASDTSTHGGFSVPRRAAEDCFPPLDYGQQRPSQELVAKDLHGSEWRFRHIYRGQPRRHLLTTGWSAFVNKKKLVSGDAVLFLRGEDGELRLGIRRAVQLKSSGSFGGLSGMQLDPGSLMDVVNALSKRSAFSVCYNPRVSSSEFIIPVNKFLKSLDCSYSAGMRFRMRFETEDAAERRFTGLIAGISDADPVRWPGSKWKCLLVRWDDIEASRHNNRVSPWEIEPSGSASNSSNLMAASLKRTRIGFTSAKLEFPVPNGIGASDFGESLRFRKVLQGQEILLCPPYGRASFDEARGSGCIGRYDGYPMLGSRNGWPAQMHDAATHLHASVTSGQVSSPSSVLMFQQAVNPVSNSRYDNINLNQGSYISEAKSGMFAPSLSDKPILSSGLALEGTTSFGVHDFHNNNNLLDGSRSRDSVLAMRDNQDMVSCKTGCRLFGFSLTDDTHIGGG
ncbi:putative transcription factor ARF family [Medicago truncatula]|uniref:Auxin response factor n=1 Tax=Medicago truncatula TaxID=3880 RepID=A0A072V4H4_MEDTR|nr:auxin response factor 3 [Medicago truncatula]RHN72002.1 putative transcription factor ARF family [Medicago truncatula]